MSSTLKITVALAMLTAITACAGPEPEEVVIVQPAPVVVEPVGGKF